MILNNLHKKTPTLKKINITKSGYSKILKKIIYLHKCIQKNQTVYNYLK